MNERVNKFLLAGDKFMPEIHIQQPDLTYSACLPYTKSKERIQKFMQTGIIFTKMILISLVFNMIWLMVNIKILKKEHNQIRF